MMKIKDPLCAVPHVWEGRAVAQADNRWGPDSSPDQVMWDLWWTKRHWGRFFSECFGFPCKVFYLLLHTHHHPSSSGAGIIGQ
jgi:hypothetical protein